jgi:hypothetical protein
LIGVCDDGKENCIAFDGLGQIIVSDKKSNFYKRSVDSKSGSYSVGQTYHVEIVHDGKKVKTFVDDVERHEASCGPLQSGGIFLWLHADYPLIVERLEIEGKLGAASLERLRSDEIARRVAELGFP